MGTRHITYMDLGGLEVATRNPKDHDLPAIVSSLRRYGWNSPAELDERTGRMVVGHGRREATIMMRQNGEPPPGGVFIDDDGEWLVPVLRDGFCSRDDAEAEAYIIAHNSLGESGGWIDRTLAAMLEDVVTTDAPLIETTGLTFEKVDDLIRKIDPETLGDQDPDKPKSSSAPDPDPHMPLADSDEKVEGLCEACDAGRVCLKHAAGVLTPDDLSRATTTRTHTCPECDYEFED